ncbi:hypothetical protein QT381_09110 [Galbitalea sp. SE-J8]|uniref:hypothetical protein n=1 Tax=Galbitalea sp. SE-J8 TaxID=3054952 RepID=UPI00259CE731|nr:hypothetical protein [Galbitalea sp. SE-J8]MDM4763167.1 hypothetical protein [Galbitalea sp. SE-J8]
MSDIENHPEERLRYAGATTRHAGTGAPRTTLGTAPADAIGDADHVVTERADAVQADAEGTDEDADGPDARHPGAAL